jgi:hypothetical protein
MIEIYELRFDPACFNSANILNFRMDQPVGNVDELRFTEPERFKEHVRSWNKRQQYMHKSKTNINNKITKNPTSRKNRE